LDEAIEFLQRATALAPLDGWLWLDLQEVDAWAGRRAEMESAWEKSLALLPVGDLAAAWCRRGRQLRSVDCNPEASLSAYATADDLLADEVDPKLRAEILVGLAWGDAASGDGSHFEHLLSRAETLLPARPDAITRSDIVEIRMLGLIRQARFAEAVDLASAAAPHAFAARQPDRAFGVLTNAACALTCVGDHAGALVLADRAVEATIGVPSVHIGALAARAQILARIGRHDDALETVRRQQQLAERLDAPVLAATATHDAGLVAFAAGRYVEAADLLGRSLADGAAVSRPTASLRRAEALALAGDPAEATLQLRSAVLEPVTRADQPGSLVPRIAFVQGLIATAQGDEALARQRFDEAASAWHRLLGSAASATADGYLANLVDLGRPPVVGLVEPARELARIAEATSALHPVSQTPR
jgi:tetratricopeptide (TPR) repeat protein